MNQEQTRFDLFGNPAVTPDRVDITESRHGGNRFSRNANAKTMATKKEMRKRVLRYIKSRGDVGATLDEASVAFCMPPNALSGRFTELKRDVKIKPKGRRGTRSGCTAGVWVAI